jgi:predicted ATPase
LYENAEDNYIGIAIKDDNERYSQWYFDVTKDTQSTFLPISTDRSELLGDETDRLAFFTENFQYLSAERLSPQQSYQKDSYAVEHEKQISKEKGKGELIAHFMMHYGKELVQIKELHHPKEQTATLEAQVNAWLGEISPYANAIVSGSESSTALELHYEFYKKSEFRSRQYRASNVGFGLSYALPIIAAILSATPGSLILIENPEAHIHPRGQAKLMELFAKAAHAGIQIILETHSDHIVNGTLVAAHESKKWISPNEVAIHHISRNEDDFSSQCEEIKINVQGSLSHQPEGFFDQTQNDLDILI